jgi:peptide/nickel transport system substrate-binding protein
VRIPHRALLLVAGSLLVAGCAGGGGPSGNAKQGGSISIDEAAPPDSLDPAVASTLASREALWLVYTPPLTYKRAEGKEGTKLIPGLADAPPQVSEGATQWSFRFRKGLRYSDGTPLRARDFEHTIERALLLSPEARRLFGRIRGAAAFVRRARAGAGIAGIGTDDRTRRVTIQLTDPEAAFQYALASTQAGLVPQRVAAKDMTGRPPPGIGPYRISSSARGTAFTMLRNPHWRIPGIPRGNIDEITATLEPSAARRAKDVIDGVADYMQGEPPDALMPEIRSTYEDRYREHAGLSTSYFFLNTRRPPFDSEEARQAVNYAVDGRVLRSLLAGRLEPSCNLLPPSVSGYKKLDPCPHGDRTKPPDLIKARDLVERSGKADSRVTVWGSAEPTRRRLTRYYAATLRKIGFDARARIVSPASYARIVDRRGRGAAAQTGLAERTAVLPYPGEFLAVLSNGRVHDAEINAELDRLATESDLGKANNDWVAVEKRAAERAYVAPVGYETRGTFLSERMDFENCSRFHPVYGADYSSFCLK